MKTPLDRAYANMIAAPDDDLVRLNYYARLSDAELHLMLASEADGDQISPEMFHLNEGPYVLAFDREDRLGDFANRPIAFATLSGRALAMLLAPQEIGLGVNLGAQSEYLIPPDALLWLAKTAEKSADVITKTPQEFCKPKAVPNHILEALSTKLVSATGLARAAWFSGVKYGLDDQTNNLVVFVDALRDAHSALAQAITDVLTFSGVDDQKIDVMFIGANDPLNAKLEKVGVRFDIPEPEKPRPPDAPSTNPERPPRLR